MSKRSRRWFYGAMAAVTVAALAAGAAAALPQAAGAAGASPATITVEGDGQVLITDLQASFQVGVNKSAPTASGAMTADNASMQRVIAALEARGVPATDLSTTNLSLQPQYASEPNGYSGPGRVNGFDASDTLTVTVPTLSQTGTLIDATLAAGANSLDGVNFAAADPTRSNAAALAAAVADAEAKAQAMASAAHLTLGPVVSMTTQTQQPVPMYGAALAAAPINASTPVLSGQQYASAQATVTFDASR